MSRSYRHAPFMGITCAKSDKPGKVLANRALRAATREALICCNDFDDLICPAMREVSNVWSFPKDGKQRIKTSWSDYRKYMRK